MFRDDTPVDKFIKEHEFDFEAGATEDGPDPEEAIRDIADWVADDESLKPAETKIIKAAREYFAGNVGDVTDAGPIVRNVDPNHDIENLDELLLYHFLRTGRTVDGTSRSNASDISTAAAAATTHLDTSVGVRDFVCLLEDRLRTVDTGVTREVEQFDGEIRGRVDWQETLKLRRETAAPASQTYACQVHRRDTLSARNRVLFDFLGELVGICEQFEREHVGEGDSFPNWLDKWGANGELRQAVESGLSNAHFTDVDTAEVTASDREIRTVHRDREPLYREAAALLERLREIRREGATAADAEDLFGMDVFVPQQANDGESTIYELYWHFEIVSQFEAAGIEPIDLPYGDGDDNLVAAWEDEETDSRYLLFNDWNGKATLDGDDELEYLRFGPPDARADEGPDLSTARAGHVHQAWRRIREQGLEKNFREKVGTPDIVLLELDAAAEEPTIRGVFVGEVKRTDSAHTIDAGIAQLAEYGAFAEIGDDATLAGEPDADYVATNSDFLADDRLELGLFVSSGHQVDDDPDEIQLCWFHEPEDDDGDGGVERPLRD